MTNEETGVTILMAEDDDGHATLIQDRFRSVGVRNQLVRFRDGQETLDYLAGAGGDPGKRYLLLLDIRMPRVDGIEVLRRVKGDSRLKNIPIIMLTTTDDPREISLCYELGCNNYLVKPVEFDKFTEAIKRLGLFLMIVTVDKIKSA